MHGGCEPTRPVRRSPSPLVAIGVAALAATMTVAAPGSVATAVPRPKAATAPTTLAVPTSAASPPTAVRVPGPPVAPPATVAVPESRSYILVDVNSGNVLAGYRERLRLPPASLTKVLTALIATTYLPASAHVKGTRISGSAYPNQVGIEKGVGWPLREVLQSLLVYSANDAAYAIAQRVSGSLTAFEPVMERSALEIGMSDSPGFPRPRRPRRHGGSRRRKPG